MSPTEFAKLRSLPPAEAIAYMQGRQLVAETYHWHDLWESEHERAFTVSRLTRADLLEAVQESLTKAVAGDLTRRDWMADTRKLLQGAGWWGDVQVTDPRTGEQLKSRFNNARLSLIFDVNTRQAAAAGQWQRILRTKESRPYVRYLTMDDSRVRELHRSWHNVTLPVEHPWLETHRPPNGYRCRCRLISMSRAEYERGHVLTRPGAETDQDAPLVKELLKKEPPADALVSWENPRTRETQMIPAGIDPGFAYAPGTTGANQAFKAMVENKLQRLSPAIRQEVEAHRLNTGLPDPGFMGQRPGLYELPPMPVVSLDSAVLGAKLSHQDLMAKATEVLKAIQTSDGLVNDDTGWLLTVNRKGVKKMGDNKQQSDSSLQSIAGALVELVRNAVVVEQHPDIKHGNAVVQAISRLLAAIEIDGVLYRVKLTIKDLAAPDKLAKLLHALDTAEIESAPLGTLLTGTDLSELRSTQPTTGRFVTIADLLRGALRNDGLPFEE